jgi:MerR family copper efflux transcriptional regulator
MTTSMNRTRVMTVGELSRRTAVPIKTLRAYTDLGLISTLGRSPANYRLFDTEALWCVRLIGELRGLGLTVAEIRELVATTRPTGPRLAELLRRSRQRLTHRIAQHQETLRRIEAFETEHHADLAEDGLCWAGEPGCGATRA